MQAYSLSRLQSWVQLKAPHPLRAPLQANQVLIQGELLGRLGLHEALARLLGRLARLLGRLARLLGALARLMNFRE
jgi:hypothetical protein